MRYLTREMERKMQFFGIAFEGMNLENLVNEWSNSEDPLDVYEIFYKEIEEHKNDMIRLLPMDLKNKIFNYDGSIKKDILNDELYNELVKYKKEFLNEWKESCYSASREEKKIQKSLPKSIKKLRSLCMHDEDVSTIYFEESNRLIIELQEQSWGKPILIFNGVEKADISNKVYPAWWLYDELFGLDNGKYEYNVLFREGEISVVFNDFEIKAKLRRYIENIIEEFSEEAVNKRISEIKERTIEEGRKDLSEESISYLENKLFGDMGFYETLTKCISHKMHFAGRNNLSKIEKDILLFSEFLYSLIYDTVSIKSGFKKGGFYNIRGYSKSKLNNILELLSKMGPRYLYRITLEAKSIFEEANEEEKKNKINKLDARINRRYRKKHGKSIEIFSSFANYVKMNKDKF